MPDHLFAPLKLRGLSVRNRIVMSPMCMYSAATDGRAADWHLAHYLARAVGGVGLILTEATAVEPRGRISQGDLGLWSDAQIEPLARIARAVQAEGAAIGAQLAHAGRKAFTPTTGQDPQHPVAPSPVPFDQGYCVPQELDQAGIDHLVETVRASVKMLKKARIKVSTLVKWSHLRHNGLVNRSAEEWTTHAECGDPIHDKRSVS